MTRAPAGVERTSNRQPPRLADADGAVATLPSDGCLFDPAIAGGIREASAEGTGASGSPE